MRKVLTDRGTEYKNQTLQELFNMLDVKHAPSTAYHHQTVGSIERSHRTFNEYIRSYVSLERTDWDEWLKYFTYCFNTTPSTIHGYCPYELVSGKIPNIIDSIGFNTVDPLYNVDSYEKEVKYRLQMARQRATKMITQSKFSNKLQYDKTANPLHVQIGDLVLVENNGGHKLEQLFKGPYSVENIDSNGNCSLSLSDRRNIEVHKNRLKLFNALSNNLN